MCLTSLHEFHRTPKQGIGKGWKIFRRTSKGTLLSGFMHYLENFMDGTLSKRPELSFNQWLEDPSEGQIRAKLPGFYNPSNGSYRTGFHLFKSLKDAERILEEYPPLHHKPMEMIVLEVEYDDVVAEGVQSFGEVDEWDYFVPSIENVSVIVARKMKILEPVVLQMEPVI